MIKHVVLFKLAPFAEGHSKHENALYLKDELEKLQDLIPELLKIEIVLNMSDVSATNYDLMLIADFNNLQDLDIYVNHPDHVKIGLFMSKVRTDRAAIDYQL